MKSPEPSSASSPAATPEYRPVLTGAEWHVLRTVMSEALQKPGQHEWVRDIFADFEILLGRRSTAHRRTVNLQELLSLAGWWDKLGEHGHRIPAHLKGEDVSVDVWLSDEETSRLMRVCREIQCRHTGRADVFLDLGRLYAALADRPRLGTRQAVKQSASRLRVPTMRLQEKVASGSEPLQRAFRSLTGSARRHTRG